MITIQARVSKQGWDTAPTMRARTRESGFRSAARRLGLRGPILTVERVGSSQWAVNVGGTMMMVVETGPNRARREVF